MGLRGSQEYSVSTRGLSLLVPGTHVVDYLVELRIDLVLANITLRQILQLPAQLLQLLRIILHFGNEITGILHMLQADGILVGLRTLVEHIRHAVFAQPQLQDF